MTGFTDHPMPLWARLFILFIVFPGSMVLMNWNDVMSWDWGLIITELFGG